MLFQGVPGLPQNDRTRQIKVVEMRICDKCKKKLKNGDGNVHIDLGFPFEYDLCKKCEEKFLFHVNDFFEFTEYDK